MLDVFIGIHYNSGIGGDHVKKAEFSGGLYFLVHFLLEITSFYILTCYTDSAVIWLLLLFYDAAAFVPQGLFGWLYDKGIKINFALTGTLLTSAALVLLAVSANAFVTVAVLSLGNCMVHIHGAETTLRASPGRMTPAAVFVSGGSFGVITGKLLSAAEIPVPWILAFNLLSVIPILIAERLRSSDGADGSENLRKYCYANTAVSAAVIIAAATFVVAVRAYMGYGIPTGWNKTTLQAVALYGCMGLGKALGGVLTDRIGIRRTALISTVGALPFLVLGADCMPVSLIGISVFSMTMPVTLALIVSCLQRYPGVSFGFTTLGLFWGSVPVFFIRVQSVFWNCVMLAALTAVCTLFLLILCAKPTARKESEKNVN